jgi:hypothetical protein
MTPDPSITAAGLPRARTALDTLAWLADEAYRGDAAQSLLAGLNGLRDADWAAILSADVPSLAGSHRDALAPLPP